MRKPTILIADDDAHMRASMRTRLKQMGYQVVESHDGLSVLCQTPQVQVDLIILDQCMPNGDGRDIARFIRNELDVPIVFLSGRDREEFRSIVMQLPNTYYLSKPVDYERLASLFGSLLPAPTNQVELTAALA